VGGGVWGCVIYRLSRRPILDRMFRIIRGDVFSCEEEEQNYCFAMGASGFF